MSRGDERLVVEAFAAWLTGQGWTVRFEVDWWDLLAERDGQRLYVEAKGRTAAPGLDVDTAFGQVIRRMPADDDPAALFALVVRDEPKSVRAAVRVPIRARRLLRITVFAVSDDGAVRELVSVHG
jgi:hypothetical protein